MKKNTGKPYELFTKAIFKQLLDQDKVKTTKLEHDITLEGKSGKHQIDIWWEFEAGGVKYCTAVQAKDWGQKVSQVQVWTFKGVLDDLYERPSGIMVTPLGYQSGAKEVAEKNGIRLYELREIKDKDWIGKIQTITINMTMLTPVIEDVKFSPDRTWLDQKMNELNIPDGEEIGMGGLVENVSIYDEKGAQVASFADVLKPYMPQSFEKDTNIRITHTFDHPMYVDTIHEKLKRLLVIGFEARIATKIQTEQIRYSGEDFVHFILNNVLDKKTHLFTKEQSLIR